MMGNPLLLIAACSTTKRAPVPVQRCLRSVGGNSLEQRAVAWRQRLADSAVDGIPAVDLYGGGYWSVVRNLPRLAAHAGFETSLCVASAGYGLVPGDQRLLGYSATFGKGHPDSVPQMKSAPSAASETRVSWWRLMSTGAGELPITERVKRAPKTTLMVVASPVYLDAMSEDLGTAAMHLASRSRLLIISSRLPNTLERLSDHLVPSVAALQPFLGGALASLHARTAQHVLENNTPPLSAVALQARYRTMADTHPAPHRPRRATASDTQVRGFIERQLAMNPTTSRTRLLRAFRETSRGCAQERFDRLFRAVRESHATTS